LFSFKKSVRANEVKSEGKKHSTDILVILSISNLMRHLK